MFSTFITQFNSDADNSGGATMRRQHKTLFLYNNTYFYTQRPTAGSLVAIR